MLPTEALVDEVLRFCFFYFLFVLVWRPSTLTPEDIVDDVGDADEVG